MASLPPAPAAAGTAPAAPRELPWTRPCALAARPELGPGLDPVALRPALEELSRAEGVRAVLLFGSRARGEAQVDSDLDLVVIAAEPRLTPRQRLDGWRRFRALLGDLPVGLDLIVTGWADAERMAQSRWHVMGDVAREGLALHVAG